MKLSTIRFLPTVKMNDVISLKPMSDEMYYEYFKEYQTDHDTFINESDYYDYRYSEKTIRDYIARQRNKRRICYAIMLHEEIIGEIKLSDINDEQSCVSGISMKNAKYKDNGYRTRAERLTVEHVFNVPDIPRAYADATLKNTRSQRVPGKVGFLKIKEDEERFYYQIDRKNAEISEF